MPYFAWTSNHVSFLHDRNLAIPCADRICVALRSLRWSDILQLWCAQPWQGRSHHHDCHVLTCTWSLCLEINLPSATALDCLWTVAWIGTLRLGFSKVLWLQQWWSQGFIEIALLSASNTVVTTRVSPHHCAFFALKPPINHLFFGRNLLISCTVYTQVELECLPWSDRMQLSLAKMSQLKILSLRLFCTARTCSFSVVIMQSNNTSHNWVKELLIGAWSNSSL